MVKNLERIGIVKVDPYIAIVALGVIISEKSKDLIFRFPMHFIVILFYAEIGWTPHVQYVFC